MSNMIELKKADAFSDHPGKWIDHNGKLKITAYWEGSDFIIEVSATFFFICLYKKWVIKKHSNLNS